MDPNGVNITLKNVPEELHARLKERAARHRRSLNAEAILCLERGLGTVAIDPSELRQRLQLLRERAGGYLTSERIDEARREGRE